MLLPASYQPLIQFRWICSALLFYSAFLWQLIDVGCSWVIFCDSSSSLWFSAKLVGLVLFLLTFTIFRFFAFRRYSFFFNNFTTHKLTLEQIDDLHCLFQLGRLQQVQTGWTFAFRTRLLGTAAHIYRHNRENKNSLQASVSHFTRKNWAPLSLTHLWHTATLLCPLRLIPSDFFNQFNQIYFSPFLHSHSARFSWCPNFT